MSKARHRLPRRTVVSRLINVQPGPVNVNVLNGARVTFLTVNINTTPRNATYIRD